MLHSGQFVEAMDGPYTRVPLCRESIDHESPGCVVLLDSLEDHTPVQDANHAHEEVYKV
jgi:hypothetical protein